MSALRTHPEAGLIREASARRVSRARFAATMRKGLVRGPLTRPPERRLQRRGVAAREQSDARRGDGAQDRHRALGCTRREDQREQRDRVAQPFLHTAQRTAPVVGDDEHPLTYERHDRNAQERPATAK